MKLRFVLTVCALLALAAAAGFLLTTPQAESWSMKIGKLFQPEKREKPASASRSRIENNILSRLRLLEIADSTVRFRKHDSLIEVRAVIPRGKPVEWILWHLSAAVKGTPYGVEDCYCPKNGRRCFIRFSERSGRHPPVVLSIRWASRYFSESAGLAVFVTDLGSAEDSTMLAYLSFPEPLTVSFFSGHSRAPLTANVAAERHKETVVLLPMEPASPRSSKGTTPVLMIHLPNGKVRSAIDAADVIPGRAGFGNVGGARALADSRLTGLLFSEIKKRNGYFLETPVTRKSMTARFARRHGVPLAVVDHTVDRSLTAAQIQQLLCNWIPETQRHGRLIIATSPTDAFLRALHRELPTLRQNGIRLTFVSELIRDDKKER